MPLFVEHYLPEATGRGKEIFDLVVLAHHEAREIVRGSVRRKEVSPPSWKPLGRRAVEFFVRSRV